MKKLLTLVLMISGFNQPIEASESVFVLVHGAHFTKASWTYVESALMRAGHSVTSVELPGRGRDPIAAADVDIKVAAARVCDVLKADLRPAILVGHSQGGAVMTQTLAQCPGRVKALVYVAAVVPLPGETAFERLTVAENAVYSQCAAVDFEKRLFVANRQGPIERYFFGDLRAIDAQAAFVANLSIVDEPAMIASTKLDYPEAVLHSLPKFYIEATEDRILSLATQRGYQERVPMTSVYSIESSHAPFLSKPDQLAELLVSIKVRLKRAPFGKSDAIKVVESYFDALQTGKFELDRAPLVGQPGLRV